MQLQVDFPDKQACKQTQSAQLKISPGSDASPHHHPERKTHKPCHSSTASRKIMTMRVKLATSGTSCSALLPPTHTPHGGETADSPHTPRQGREGNIFSCGMKKLHSNQLQSLGKKERAAQNSLFLPDLGMCGCVWLWPGCSPPSLGRSKQLKAAAASASSPAALSC